MELPLNRELPGLVNEERIAVSVSSVVELKDVVNESAQKEVLGEVQAGDALVMDEDKDSKERSILSGPVKYGLSSSGGVGPATFIWSTDFAVGAR